MQLYNGPCIWKRTVLPLEKQRWTAIFKTENKKSNNSFLSREKYDLLIQEISQLKRGDRKKEPQ